MDQRYCGASTGNARVTGLDFADDAAILATPMKVLVLALEVLLGGDIAFGT